VLIGAPIDDTVANATIASLLYLANQNSDPIMVYINSPGGAVAPGLAIIDTLDELGLSVTTMCVGQAQAMALQILASGQRGRRVALKTATMSLSPLFGGELEQPKDQFIQKKEIGRLQNILIMMLAAKTGTRSEVVAEDFLKGRSFSAEEAMEYGLIDEIVEVRTSGT